MAHILEAIKSPETTFSALEVLSGEITALIVRMSDYSRLRSEDDQQIVESWRNQLYLIRCAVENMGNSE